MITRIYLKIAKYPQNKRKSCVLRVTDAQRELIRKHFPEAHILDEVRLH